MANGKFKAGKTKGSCPPGKRKVGNKCVPRVNRQKKAKGKAEAQQRGRRWVSKNRDFLKKAKANLPK